MAPATPPNAALELQRSMSIMVGVIVAVVVTCALYFGREILIPLALAVLLSFVLAPLVRMLQRIKVPKAVAVIGVVLSAFLIIAGLGTVIAGQVTGLASELPSYERTIRDKIKSVRGMAAGNGALERAADVLQDLGKELQKPEQNGTPALSRNPTENSAPVPVEIRAPESGAFRTLANLVGPLLHPLATTGIIIIFVIFILMRREDLRNRMIRLAGAQDLHRTTAAMDDAANRLSKFFLVQVALNASFGVVVGTGLFFIGVPTPVLWGVLAAVMRFIPYVGAAISALFPLALAAAVDPGWTMLVWTAALFLIVEPIVGHVIEPLVYGQSTGLSPVAVVTAATFWTWLWGPIGLVLATPLTVCLVVLGRHVEQLAVFDVLFGDQPVLSAPEMFYQRMLAADPTEAVEQAETFLEDASMAEYLDTVALPGIRLGAQDATRGALEPERMTTVRDSVGELVDDLEDLVSTDEATLPDAWGEDGDVDDGTPRPVVSVGLRNALDDAAAMLFALLSRRRGLRTRVLAPEVLTLSNLFRLDLRGVEVICLSVFETSSPVHIRYALRRLKRKAPNATIVVGYWKQDDPEAIEGLREVIAPAQLVTTLAEAVAAAQTAMADVDPPEAAAERPPAEPHLGVVAQAAGA
ncbi:ABC transporter permease [Alsobacter metallidurans]|uniref:ABC transporter permease n=1 Tax=Alsobacter metallidurans TaxID=340221 RepID=A0A917I2C4_9HYPH|nr:AI-2E family transporter [Alsobacter metallidurans]GGH06677.1 ABC transporter permease [Alsobacter metallidurans]